MLESLNYPLTCSTNKNQEFSSKSFAPTVNSSGCKFILLIKIDLYNQV